MAPNFTPFTGFSYATGLASLGQGLNRLSDAWQLQADREMFEKAFAGNPRAMALARAGQPGLAFQENSRSEDQKRDERAAGIAGGLGGLGAGLGGAPAGASGAGFTSQSGDPLGAGLLRKFEGFREKPYWDVNAHRTGYGSDTVTRADGSVQRVTPGTTVSREDAERDLGRRINTEFLPRAAEAVGPAWGTLSKNAREALVSVTYNYGSLPGSVAAAARTGDPQAIASAIAGLSGHNGGINARRRQQEAQYVLQGGSPAPQQVAGMNPEVGSGRFALDQPPASVVPQQVAGSSPFPTPAQYDAAADAIRANREGGPRLVLSPQHPLNPGGAPPAGPEPIQDDPSIPNEGPGTALAYNRPPQAPAQAPQVAGANPADLPAPGASPVSQERFTIPGTNETVPAAAAGRLMEIRQRMTGAASETPEMQALKEQAARYRQAAAIASPAQRSMYMQSAMQAEQEYRQRQAQQMQLAATEFREEIGNLRTLAKEEREAERNRVRVITDPQERAALGVPPDYKGVVAVDGKGMPHFPGKPTTEIKNEGTIPPGYRAVRDERGNVERLEVIPGSKAAKEAADAERKDVARRQQSEMTGGVVANALDDIDRLMTGAWLPVTGAAGSRLAGISGTAAHDVASALNTIKANISFERIDQMRQASPTGGALGAITEGEHKLLAGSMAALEQSQSEQQFKTNLGRVRANFERIVHGRTLTTQERRSGGPMTMERAKGLRDEASQAIASGAPKASVLKRLKDFGVDVSGL